MWYIVIKLSYKLLISVLSEKCLSISGSRWSLLMQCFIINTCENIICNKFSGYKYGHVLDPNCSINVEHPTNWYLVG